MLDVIISRHTWSGQIRTHIHAKIHAHKKQNTTKKWGKKTQNFEKGGWVEKKERKEEKKKRMRVGKKGKKRTQEGGGIGFRGVEEKG